MDVEWRKDIRGICPAGCWVELGSDGTKISDFRSDESDALGMICNRHIFFWRSEEEARCPVWFSLSHDTTQKDIDKSMTARGEVLEELESTVRFLPCR